MKALLGMVVLLAVSAAILLAAVALTGLALHWIVDAFTFGWEYRS